MKGLPRAWETNPAGITKLIAINATAPQLLACYLIPAMIAKGWGRIVNVTTSFDTMLREGMNAYGASKAALEACSAIWAKELHGTGVTVNVLVPGGPTATAFLPPHMRAGGLDPNIMRAPIRWLTSGKSDGVTGRRFVARLWDASDAEDRAAEFGEPAAWPNLAEKARQTKN
jgi:3-oxoacyl-[acyl-carrier protein] reductase